MTASAASLPAHHYRRHLGIARRHVDCAGMGAPVLKMTATPVPPLKVPDVISMSYADAEFTLGADYVERCNIELSKLAARGVSVIAASGTPPIF